MFRSFGQDAGNVELIEEKIFCIAYDEENEANFRLGLTKTKKYLVIQALFIDDIVNSLFAFFQTKLTLNNLKEKSDKFEKNSTMDDCYQIIIDSFEENKVEIKDIVKTKYLKLSFLFDIKTLDINLPNKKIDIEYNELLENFKINYDEYVAKKGQKIETDENKNEENKIEDNNDNIKDENNANELDNNENYNNEEEVVNNEDKGDEENQYDENYNNDEEENVNNEEEYQENENNNEEENVNNEYQENIENQEN